MNAIDLPSATAVRPRSFADAVREAIAGEMEHDASVFVIGEDVRIGGGFGVTKDLAARFGDDRIIDTPISEIAFTGLAIGAAMSGMRPIVEYQFGDFVLCAMDQIVNQAAKLHYMSNGQVTVPITFRLPVGANRRGAQHAQCTESMFMNVPGLQIATPATPFDAKGLLAAAIRSDNPVLFYEHKLLYPMGGATSPLPAELHAEVPDSSYSLPLGRAVMRRMGRHATVVATMLMLHRTIAAAHALEREGIELEVIDPRTLVPLDLDCISDSVRRTGLLMIVEETPEVGGWGGEIIASVHARLGGSFGSKRISMLPAPVPYAVTLENAVIPSVERITAEVRGTLRAKEARLG